MGYRGLKVKRRAKISPWSESVHDSSGSKQSATWVYVFPGCRHTLKTDSPRTSIVKYQVTRSGAESRVTPAVQPFSWRARSSLLSRLVAMDAIAEE